MSVRGFTFWIACGFVVVFLFFSSFVSANYDGVAPRPFKVEKFANIGLEVWVPARPKWHIETQQRKLTTAVVLGSPSGYYPRTAIEILFFKDKTSEEVDLPAITKGVIESIQINNGSLTKDDKLSRIETGNIIVFQSEHELNIEGKTHSLHLFVGHFKDTKELLNVSVITPQGQGDHGVEMRDKILRKLALI